MQVILTETERRIARYVGNLRNEIAIATNARDDRKADRDGKLVHQEGAGAEIGFCRLTNTYWHPSTEGPEKIDTTLHSGLTVDVKGTPIKTGWLLRPAKANGIADVYALMTGQDFVYTFRGWCTAGHLMGRRKDFGRGPDFGREQGELCPDLAALLALGGLHDLEQFKFPDFLAEDKKGAPEPVDDLSDEEFVEEIDGVEL